MNGFKRIIVWALLSIMLQAAGLLYLDKVYFKTSSDFEVQEVTEETTTIDVDLPVPSEATNIESSFDGKYVSYYIDSSLYLLDTTTGTSEEIITNDGDRQVLFSKWLPDINKLAIAEKTVNSSKKTIINLISFDAKNKTELALIENGTVSYSSGMKVNAMEITTQNGVIYMPVSKSGGSVSIYRWNINNTIQSTGIQLSTLGGIKVSPSNDYMIYQDGKSKKFYCYTAGKSVSINLTDPSKYKLLGVDKNKIAYLGELSGEKIAKIVYGSIDNKFATWQTIQLDKAVSTDEIYIDNKNEILVNDSLQGKIKNLTTNQTVSYTGKFISVNNKVILSKDNDKLYVKSLTDVDK